MAGSVTRQEPSPAYSNQQCGEVHATKLVCYYHFFNLKKLERFGIAKVKANMTNKPSLLEKSHRMSRQSVCIHFSELC